MAPVHVSIPADANNIEQVFCGSVSNRPASRIHGVAVLLTPGEQTVSL
jgi:hypothetical protein